MSRTKRKSYDPGDFNHKILFYVEGVTIDQYGDQVLSTELANIPVTGIWAKRTEIKDYNQTAIQAGASIENKDRIFTIRSRKDFYPSKPMLIKDYRTGEWYNIAAVREIDDPVFYLEIVAIRKDNYAPYITGDELFYGTGSSIPTSVMGLNNIPFTDTVVLNTGSNTVFFILLPGNRSVVSVKDLDSTLAYNITSLYTINGTLEHAGKTYNIWSMQTSVPYSPSHRHEFKLI